MRRDVFNHASLFWMLVSLSLNGAEVVNLSRQGFSLANNKLHQVNLNSLLELGEMCNFQLINTVRDSRINKNHYRYQQTYNGIDVYGYQALVATDDQDNILSIDGAIIKGIEKDIINPVKTYGNDYLLMTMKQTYAKEKMIRSVDEIVFHEEEVAPIIYIKNNHAYLCHKITFMAEPLNILPDPEMPVYYVNMADLSVVEHYDTLFHCLDRGGELIKAGGPGGNPKTGKYFYGKERPNFEVTDCGNGKAEFTVTKTLSTGTNYTISIVDWANSKFTSSTVRFTPPTYEQASAFGSYCPMNDAHASAWNVVSMYDKWFKTPVSPKDTLRIGVRYDWLYENASTSTNGETITLGDGYEKFYSFVAQDVIGHEMGHTFVVKHSKLEYKEQSGGIHEAFADMSGKASEFFTFGKNPWHFASEICRQKEAARFMDDPEKDGNSIGSASKFKAGMKPHYANGVFNKAFYSLATTSGWDTKKAFEVFVKANQAYWTPTETFASGASGVLKATKDLGYNTADVVNAFKKVDISVE